MTVKYSDSSEPGDLKPFTDEEMDRGYRRLSSGFLPGSTGDPDHDGEVRPDGDWGSGFEYNAGAVSGHDPAPRGARVFTPERKPEGKR